MPYVITEPCVDLKSKACVDECPVDCIYEGERMLYIHPEECIECGACESVCPVEAIYYEDDVPEKWHHYIQANVDFFKDLGSPGGSSALGPLPFDAPLLTNNGQQHALSTPEPAGILREFAGLAQPQSGTIALVSPVVGITKSLLHALLLFYDRILIIQSSSSSPRGLGDDIAELRESGVVDVAGIDMWLMHLGTNLLHSCEYLSGLESSIKGSLPLYKPGSRKTRTFARLKALAMEANVEFGQKQWQPIVSSMAEILFPLLIQAAAWQKDFSIDLITADTAFTAALHSITTVPGSEQAGIWDFEAVTPDVSEVPPADLIAFRAEYGHFFTGHLDLLKGNMLKSHTEPGSNSWERWAELRDSIAESAYLLSRTASSLKSMENGSWDLGAIGDLRQPDISGTHETGVARRALAAGGTSSSRGDPPIFAFVFSWARNWQPSSYNELP